MKKTFNRILLAVALLALPISPLILTGCGHATLAPGGAYAPMVTNIDATTGASTVVLKGTDTANFAFFEVESAYLLAWNSMNTIFDFERENRVALWRVSPEIKHTLDKIRPQAQTVALKYAVARQAYLANPVTEKLTTLKGVLQEAQAVGAIVAAVLPSNAPTPPGGGATATASH